MSSTGAVLSSVLERALGRPFKSRDRVLRAFSEDGLRWSRDPGFRLVHPTHLRDHMTYYAATDRGGRLWARASVYEGPSEGWRTELYREGSWRGVDGLGVRHLLGLSWCGERLYAVAEPSSGARTIECFRPGDDGWPTVREEQSWAGLADLAIEDVSVIALDDGFRAWGSVVESPTDTSIHAWSSVDGRRWDHHGEALASPFDGHWFQLANNPCVAAIRGGWRMYFRSGHQPAVGNTIRSAVSDDLERWTHEPGDRLSPGGSWDSDGVGFPFVAESPGPRMTMYYAGYWGRSRPGHQTAQHWSRVGAELQRQRRASITSH